MVRGYVSAGWGLNKGFCFLLEATIYRILSSYKTIWVSAVEGARWFYISGGPIHGYYNVGLRLMGKKL